LDQLRRGAEWRRQDQQSARAVVSDADIITLLERPLATTARQRALASVQGFVAPTLVLLAAVSILQGYTLLNVLPAGGWQTSAILFAAVTFPLSVLLARLRGGSPRTVTNVAVTSSAALVAVMTVVALVIDRPSVTHLLGVCDLAFALLALGAVLANERADHHMGPG
jgi:hypothetical protein